MVAQAATGEAKPGPLSRFVRVLYSVEVDEVRVWIVSEDPLARSGLASLLSTQEGLSIVGQGTPEEAGALPPAASVVVWDLGGGTPERIPDGGDVPILALLSEEFQAGEALAAGARGVCLRDTDPERLAAALRAVAHGLVVLDEASAETALKPPSRTPALVEELTPREIEVLGLLSEGLSNKAIALRLSISDQTVKFHVNAILGKLGAESRTEAVVLAARLGIVAL